MDTRIFARPAPGGRQVLIYEMKLASAEPVAMVLPIPAPSGCAEDAVRFVSLEAYPDLFDDLEKAFPRPEPTRGLWREYAQALPVQEVGAFVASFVPSLADFDRIDPQFRMSPTLFEWVPEYDGWGYVVFQLQVPAHELVRVHPMAFEFPTRHPDRLFFPTLHIHDGSLRSKAVFSHALYAQGHAPEAWDRVDALHGAVDRQRAAGLIDEAPTWRTEIKGEALNRDTWA